MADHEAEPGAFPVALWTAADLVTPMAIRVAATLGLADHVATGIRDVDGLAEATGSDPDALRRLLEHLVRAGILTREADGYATTDLGAQLHSDHPGRGRQWLRTDGAVGRADLSLVELLATVRTGEPAYPRHHGRGFWEDLASDATLAATFDEVMSSRFRGSAHDVVAAHQWDRHDHVVDVGGGDGTLLRELLLATPGLRGTLVELAGPAAAARERMAEADLAERVAVVEGSFFDPLTDEGDAYVLSGVVHDWDDDDATRILRRCRDAAGPDGVVLLLEGVDDGGVTSSEMDLRMLAYFGGRERNLEDLRELAARADLELVGAHPAGSDRSLVELRPV